MNLLYSTFDTLREDRIAELLGPCLRSTNFGYCDEFYDQIEGATMGSPVSAVVANLYIFRGASPTYSSL